MRSLTGGGGDTHHHGLLAGLGAGTAGVLTVAGLALLLARHAMTTVLDDALWLLFAVLIAGAVAGVLLLYRYLWHRHVQFSAAAPSRPVPQGEIAPPSFRAEVLPPAAEAITGGVHLHLPEGMAPEHVAALLAGLRGGERHAELES